MSNKSIQASDTILGYTLVERIGSGGYGEVWSAIAPGGLKKAVKFVYGFHDEKRAQTEIKALDRVKQLRHPFLLSLERIDIVDDQLVIISELADGCLADIFNAYHQKGEPGIPREELLPYIRDTADALDYLTQQHSLQHLDIKPENLLLVGGHVKVADFGLVKELEVSNQSLMTGMTPAYAAPELFDGRPGECSDQYSLAIVYQEMLTSLRPFPGTTPAQLAAQHMHGRPNLRNLPSGDAAVLAKALSKDPNARFNSCREMVDELYQKKIRKKTIRRLGTVAERLNTSGTIVLDDVTRDVTAVVSSGSLPFQSVELERLGPPKLTDKETELQPTIIVAVGSMATQAAVKFKQRIHARHGSIREVPAVKIVCVDTDRNGLAELASSRDGCKMEESELLPTALRKPEFYRDQASTKLSWLGRRWIYNIPRSLQTEGLRPLGRLAFADHFESICQRFNRVIDEMTSEEALAATSETVGISPAANIQPRVIVMGSISGGVSGMLFDVAYTVRTLLIEKGYDSSNVHAIMMHSTNRRSREPGLSAANAFTFLTELRHYTEFGYPGDDSLGLPSFHEEPPFDDFYYLDLGDDLKQTVLDEKLNSIAEWIYLNSLSNCGMFFDACRQETRESEHFDLRTFGLSISGQGKSNSGIRQADDLAVALINTWLNGSPVDHEAARAEARELFDDYEFHCDGVVNSLDEHLQTFLPTDVFNNMLHKSRKFFEADATKAVKQLIEYFDSIFGVRLANQEVGYRTPDFATRFEAEVGNLALGLGDEMASRVSSKFNQNTLRLANPAEFLTVCTERFEQLKSKLEDACKGCDNKINDVVSVLDDLVKDSRQGSKEYQSALDQCLESYRLFRWQEFLLRNSRAYVSIVNKSLIATRATVDKYREVLVGLRAEIDKDATDEVPGPDYGFNLERLMSEKVAQMTPKLVERMEIQLFHELVSEQGGFARFLNDPFKAVSDYPVWFQQTAIQILTDTYKKISVDELITENDIAPDEVFAWLNEQLNTALPDVRTCGGGARLIVAQPQFSKKSQLTEVLNQQFGTQAIGVNGTAGDFVLCFEAEGLSLAGVAFQLLEQRPDAAELSKRIHCRKDIDWNSLDDLL